MRSRDRMLGWLSLTSVAWLGVAACRERRERIVVGPVPDAERVAPTTPPPSPRDSATVTATIRGRFAVGWGDVFEIDLEGRIAGPATLWVPAGDFRETGLVAGAFVSHAALAMELSPIASPDAGAGGPYALHVEQRGDGGTAYWGVTRLSVAAH